jgi:hypothetical protein
VKSLALIVLACSWTSVAAAQETAPEQAPPEQAPPEEEVALEEEAPERATPAEEAALEESVEPARADEVEENDEEGASIASAVRERENLRPWHMIFGSLTGAATYATTILGFLQYNDRYGWSGDPNDTGCARLDALLGMDGCDGPPLAHASLAGTATVLFGAAFTIALFMPDPLQASEGSSELATLLTVHKALRWVLLGLFVGQIVLGAISANVDADFETNRAIATSHLVLGTVTWATMTTQGVIGSMMAW